MDVFLQDIVQCVPASIKQNKRHGLYFKIKMSLWLIVLLKALFDMAFNVNGIASIVNDN